MLSSYIRILELSATSEAAGNETLTEEEVTAEGMDPTRRRRGSHLGIGAQTSTVALALKGPDDSIARGVNYATICDCPREELTPIAVRDRVPSTFQYYTPSTNLTRRLS